MFRLNYGRMGAYGDRDKPRLAWHTLDLGLAGSLHVYEERPQTWRAKVSLATITVLQGTFATQEAAEAAAIEYARIALREALATLEKIG